MVPAFHPSDLNWNGVRGHWSFAGRGGPFNIATTTRSGSLGSHITLLRVVIALPAGRFRWRLCFTAPAVGALQDPARPPGCSGLGYHGAGALPAGFPGPK